jgi:hypothetical protein
MSVFFRLYNNCIDNVHVLINIKHFSRGEKDVMWKVHWILLIATTNVNFHTRTRTRTHTHTRTRTRTHTRTRTRTRTHTHTHTHSLRESTNQRTFCQYIFCNTYICIVAQSSRLLYIGSGCGRVAEWSRVLDDWCCSVSMVWVQIPSREEHKFDSSKNLFGLIFRRIYIYILTSFFGVVVLHFRPVFL